MLSPHPFTKTTIFLTYLQSKNLSHLTYFMIPGDILGHQHSYQKVVRGSASHYPAMFAFLLLVLYVSVPSPKFSHFTIFLGEE